MTLTRLAPFAFVGLALAASGCHHSHGGGASSAPAANDNAPLTEAGIAIPIAPGKTEAWRSALLELLGPRYAEYESSRERFGLTSQMTFLQRTPMGDFACLIHMTGADVRASFHAMSTSKDPWDVKWRTLTQDLHGFDFGQGAKVTPTVVPLYGMDMESKERRRRELSLGRLLQEVRVTRLHLLLSPPGGSSGGCGCVLVAASSDEPWRLGAALAMVALVIARRRARGASR